MARPVISLIHATARLPLGWKPALDAWLSNARRFSLADGSLEVVLCVDQADAQQLPLDQLPQDGDVKVAVNMGRQCAVDAWNVAASVATGALLVTVADDWFPPEAWDVALDELLSEQYRQSGGDASESWNTDDAFERAVWVATGGNRDLMMFSILTRSYYERYGRVFYPDYIGMYADNDFQEQCKADGVLVDARETLPMFPHFHPAMGTAEPDEIYARQNRSEAYEVGARVFATRWPDAWRRLHPGRVMPGDAGPQRIIAVCLPGEMFSAPYLCAWTELLPHMVVKGFGVAPVFGHTASPFVTRAAMWFDLRRVAAERARPDLVLWIDDDNIISLPVFDRLLNVMDTRPDIDMVAAWTWILDDSAPEGVRVSCGRLTEDGSDVSHVPVAEMVEAAGVLKVEWSGFPVVLMRFSALERAAANAEQRNGVANPFCPLIAPNSKWGHSGEDVSFCQNLTDAGGSIYVDTGAFVQHVKLRSLGPRKVAEVAAKV